ncbi:AtzE family amidohydrolase [Halioxenophilus sp. WMMB6]|uniref:AtzE family amidohydrolase n=1 Tax=Halioxenophilus sp. WMMB6 TaxID=3073815 RepID=UPI00295E29AA|nr:AtzE family amidohydrolase [Halioxenophilus sp. WMMB6]
MFSLQAASSAAEIASAVKAQQITAQAVIEFFLERIARHNPTLNAFTEVLTERALATAAAIDKKIAAGINPGALAGVPFSVKNLFDVAGITTLAGSKINRSNTPASRDAVLIERLEAEGAILVGAVTMGEYAYDFTGENAHYGNCHNPWDTSRMSGGSSSGSGACVGGMLAPLSLGSDTNGSIRVPSSLCGLVGLKPTYGRLPRTRSFPFCDSLDHLGPLARSVTDLALSFDAMQGYDAGDHGCADRSPVATLATLNDGIEGLTIKKAAGYFDCQDFPQAEQALAKISAALGATESIAVPGAKEGRSAAYLITNAESSRLHLPRLQTQPENFDHDTRDRFIAGTMLPALWTTRAHQVRHWYLQQVLNMFQEVDVILAPATPCVAPKIGEKILRIGGEDLPLRPNLGYFTQPISAIGLPVCVVPTIDDDSHLPIGVQIIAAPWREDLCLRVAKVLEEKGYTVLEAGAFGND